MKNWLWPIALMASTVVVIVSLFLNFYALSADTPAGEMTAYAGLFEDMSGGASPALHTITLIAVILGLVALLALVALTVLKLLKVKVPATGTIALVCSIVAAVAGVCVLLFGLLFCGANTETIDIGGASIGQTMTGAIGLYFAFAGLILGAVSAFLTKKSIED